MAYILIFLMYLVQEHQMHKLIDNILNKGW